MAVFALAAFAAGAFPEIPRESSKALGITRGNRFSSGLVFVNGKFIAPPYRVERWGTGIRINKIPVTGQVIDWTEFLKTQPGYKPEVAPPPPSAAAPSEPAPAPEPKVVDDYDEMSLDDLFDDAPVPKKAVAPPPAVAAPRPAPAPNPLPAEAAPFVKNDAAKALVKRVNAQRAEIDRTLRAGGFICFGDGYSRIVGDARAAARLLAVLPEIQMKSNSGASFRAAVRAANLVYLHDLVCAELFQNRIDYRRLQELRERLRRDRELKTMMETPKSLF